MASGIGKKIEMSRNQRKNPILKYVKYLQLEEADIPFDYRISADISVLFLSLKYHRLNGGYIMSRLNALRSIRCRNPFIICQVDVADPGNMIAQLTIATFSLGYRILLSWSHMESAAILEMLYFNGNKGLEFISNKKQPTTHLQNVQHVLTCIKGINTNDAAAISKKFTTFKELIHCNESDLVTIPGLGKNKLQHIQQALRGSFF
ncbi:bifunctional RuvA domain 2-like/Restriction endonuclease type II-like/ERCC1-RAD10-SWI10 family [Babesia duncani]|uniref:Bifunctional RuvA domain 2-like/Restriction endonuclease type II-like/ERCC1-RAD10-SWI10 family n=1 Tax=Babesia duncani TaxID=323732 RepID=A0AAD9PNY9_9APIC|nr:bifunctional RuvA domain 2-like/Restriction endonuclease type II-like/ERCC1-RAD10-SWI10 family [Babesia duncani]